MAKNITAKQLEAMLADQDYKCAATGLPLTPETASLDHKIPLAAGGEHAVENLWIVHERVNAMKGTATFEEFVEMCHAVAKANPRPQ